MFKRYSEIENSYNKKFIDFFLEKCPELKDETFYVMIKYDGANYSLIFTPNEPYKIAKRSSIIGDNFYGILDVLPKYQHVIDYFQKLSNDNNIEINLFGEFYGHGIQNRIDYGNKKLVFYDIMVNGQFQPFGTIIPALKKLEVCVDILGIFSFQDALDFDVESIPNIEGVVIKPVNEYWNMHDRFILKKKTEKFQERMKPKKEKIQNSFSDNVNELRQVFESYLNENRVISAYSKYGRIESDKQIGEYIKIILEDMKKDFLKENDTSDLDKKEEKYIFNLGQEIVKFLYKALNE